MHVQKVHMKKYKSENHGDKSTGIKKKARLAL